jgi:uncharacterized protein (TIGR00297 family)
MSDIFGSIVPDLDRVTIIIAVSVCVLLGIFTYMRRILDAMGSALAAVLGVLLIVWSDFFWFLMMLTFLFASYWVTMWKFNKKSELGLGEGEQGERGIVNVLANGIIPFTIAVFSGPLNELSAGLPGLLFLVAISVATADTFASEVGVLAKEPRLIIDPQTIVEPGVNGGVTLLGNAAALAGALVVSIAGLLLMTDMFLGTGIHDLEAGIPVVVVPLVIGWLGCQLDSVLGATLQNKGYMGNNMVNFVTILTAVVVTAPFYILFT